MKLGEKEKGTSEMPNQVIIELILDGKKFSAELKGSTVDVQSHAETSKVALGSAAQAWALLTAGAGSAMYILGQIKQYTGMLLDFGEAGAKLKSTKIAFDTVAASAGLMGSEVAKNLQAAGGGMMTQAEIMGKAGRLIQESIPIRTIQELTANMAKQAPLLGDTLPQAWDKFGEALERGNLRSIKQYIGMVDAQAEYEKYATSIGVAVGRLSDEQKQAALAEVVNARLRDKVKDLGDVTETSASQIQRAKVSIEESHQSLKEKVAPIVAFLTTNWANFLALFNEKPKFGGEKMFEEASLSVLPAFVDDVKAAYGQFVEVAEDAYFKELNQFQKGQEQKKLALKALTDDQLQSFKKMATESQVVYAQDYAGYERIEKQKVDLEYDRQLKVIGAGKRTWDQLSADEQVALTNLNTWKENEYKNISQKSYEIWKAPVLQLSKTMLENDPFVEMEKSVADFTVNFEKSMTQATADGEALTKRYYDDWKKKSIEASNVIVATDPYAAMEKQAAEHINNIDKTRTESDDHWRELQRKSSIERIKLEADVYKDIQGYAVQQYGAEMALIKSREEELRRNGVDELAIKAWVNEETRKATLKRVSQEDDFFAAVRAGFQDITKVQYTWGRAGVDLVTGIFGKGGAVQTTLESFYGDFLNQKLKTWQDYWEVCKNAAVATFAKMLAEMTALWIASQVGSLFGPGIGAGKGGATGTLGLVGAGSLGAAMASGSTAAGAGMITLGNTMASGAVITGLTAGGAPASVFVPAGSAAYPFMTEAALNEAAAAGCSYSATAEGVLITAPATVGLLPLLASAGGGYLGGKIGQAVFGTQPGTVASAATGVAAGAAIGAAIGAFTPLTPIGGAILGGLGGLISGLFHSGGLVGYDAPSFLRSMPIMAFATAPRYHYRFASDEFPAILQKGERVLSREQNRNYEEDGKAGTMESLARPNQVTINFNVSGPLVTDETTLQKFVEEIDYRLHKIWRREYKA